MGMFGIIVIGGMVWIYGGYKSYIFIGDGMFRISFNNVGVIFDVMFVGGGGCGGIVREFMFSFMCFCFVMVSLLGVGGGGGGFVCVESNLVGMVFIYVVSVGVGVILGGRDVRETQFCCSGW